jgi:5'-AMP-activated protein kinase catalytic alpha subunit
LPFEDPNTANLYKKILNGEYTIPKIASEDAKDMIRNILQTNPEVRYRVQDIRRHPWYSSQQLDRIVGGIFIGLS